MRPLGRMSNTMATIPGISLGVHYHIPKWKLGVDGSISHAQYGYRSEVVNDFVLRGQVVDEASVTVTNSLVYSSIGVVYEPLRKARLSPYAIIGAGHTSLRSMWRASEAVHCQEQLGDEEPCPSPFLNESNFLGSSTTASFNYGVGVRIDIARASDISGRLSLVLQVMHHSGGAVRYLNVNSISEHFDTEPLNIGTTNAFTANADFFNGFVGIQYSLSGKPSKP